ncbi:hypothetical protein E0493_20465 [Roseomonas sp. M0104]|uniref:Uncharacterized protein n=1 Tax=Teichococcus coralli TaxID=2545983 RepID=A0A845BFT0_9PROT|nr:hypothetical protein [Pseudoroseomonas coralli]MXP65728.1 hypothetical protein [Pseudoroseomonas coralli]
MAINWSILVPVSNGIAIPTYGNYGGPSYSNGEVLTGPGQPANYSAPPVDALDVLFRFHDIAYDSPSGEVRAEADLALVQGIEELPRASLTPEGSLYAGGAILFGLALATEINGHPELLNPLEAFIATSTALQDIHYGLTHLEPDDQAALQTWLASTGSGAADLL